MSGGWRLSQGSCPPNMPWAAGAGRAARPGPRRCSGAAPPAAVAKRSGRPPSRSAAPQPSSLSVPTRPPHHRPVGCRLLPKEEMGGFVRSMRGRLRRRCLRSAARDSRHKDKDGFAGRLTGSVPPLHSRCATRVAAGCGAGAAGTTSKGGFADSILRSVPPLRHLCVPSSSWPIFSRSVCGRDDCRAPPGRTRDIEGDLGSGRVRRRLHDWYREASAVHRNPAVADVRERLSNTLLAENSTSGEMA